MPQSQTPPIPQSPVAVDGGLIFDDMGAVRAKVEELKDIGYDGWIVLESFTPEVEIIARAASIWRPVIHALSIALIPKLPNAS